MKKSAFISIKSCPKCGSESLKIQTLSGYYPLEKWESMDKDKVQIIGLKCMKCGASFMIDWRTKLPVAYTGEVDL